MGTQTTIASKIREKKDDYPDGCEGKSKLVAQGNDRSVSFYDDSIGERQSTSWDLHQQVEKANGRVTTRRIAVTHQLDWMIPSIRKRWQDLTSLIMIESKSYSVVAKKTTTQKRFYISSRNCSSKEFSRLIRQHWAIENSCHWVLDTLYREGHSQVRIERAVKNFAILRRIAHNLLKLDDSIKKSLPMKQMRAMADESYRNHLLSLAG